MPRRRSFALGGILALLVAGAGIGGIVWLKRYAPLRYDGGGSGTQVAHVAAYIEAAPGSDGEDVVFPRFRAGPDFFVGFTVWNGGPFDVTVLGVDTSNFPRGFVGMHPRDLRVARVPSADEQYGGSASLGRTVPTRKLVIRSHSGRWVWLGFRMTTCWHLGGYQSHTSVPLRLRYLGL